MAALIICLQNHKLSYDIKIFVHSFKNINQLVQQKHDMEHD